MKFKGINKRYKHFNRYQQILAVLITYGFNDIIARLPLQRYIVAARKLVKKPLITDIEKYNTVQRIRLAIQDLGPAFIKLGQMLSMRPDLVGIELADELQGLQDDVPPFSSDKARAIIENELGKSIGDIFLFFDEKPIAAASVSQVHKARLKDGKEVVIKVQRPDIKEIVFTDLEILQDLMKSLQKHIKELRNYDLVGLAAEIQHAMKKELDFVLEAQNISKFKKLYGMDVYVPEVYWGYTTEKVLTMEYVEGIKVSDVEQIVEAGIKPEQLADRCVRSMFKQIYQYGYFHADPHSGNIFVNKDGDLIFLDFGIMGRLTKEQRRNIAKAFIAVSERDVDKLANILDRMNILSEESNIKLVKKKIGELLDRYYDLPLNQIKVKKIVSDLFSEIREMKLVFPADFVLMAKAIVTLEGLVLSLDPSFHIERISSKFFKNVLVEQLHPKARYRDVKKFILETMELIEQMPSTVQVLLDKVLKGKFAISIEHLKLQELITELDRASNRISFGLIVAALIVGSSLLVQSGIGPKIYDFPIIGIIGYIIAGLLGLWLIFNILRSRNL